MGNFFNAMKKLCCCTDESRTEPHVRKPPFNQPPPAPGWINSMSTAYNIHSQEVGTEVRNEYLLHVVKSSTPTEHSLDTLSNVSDVDGPTHPVSS